MTLRLAPRVSRAVIVSTILISAVLSPSVASAQKSTAGKASTVIPAAKGGIVRGVPDIVQDTLPNGLRILFARVNDLPLSEINVIVDAGLACESSGEHGVAWTLSQLLTGSNRDRTADMVSSYLAEMGSTVIPYAHYDYAQLYARTLSRNFSGTLEVIADGIIAPLIREQELSAIQRTSSTRLQRAVSSGERASVAAVGILCGQDHVLTRYLLPVPEQVANLTREQLAAFHERCYRPSRTTVIVTGDLDYRFVRTAVIEAFGAWRDGDRAPVLRATIDAPDVAGGGAGVVRLLPEDDTPRGLAYFRMGVRAPLRGDDDFVAAVLLNSILSDGPDSRLRRLFWKDHMISPNFSAALAFSRDCSYFMISGSASPLMADSVITYTHAAVREIAEAGVPESELDAAKDYLLSSEALTFATNRSVQGLLKEAAVYRIPLQRLLTFTERLRAVSAADIRQVAGKLFQPGRWTQVALGGEVKLRPVLEAAGRTVVLLENRMKQSGQENEGSRNQPSQNEDPGENENSGENENPGEGRE